MCVRLSRPTASLLIVPNDIRADPEELIALLAAQRVTRLTLVPSMLRAMLEVQPDLGHKLPALRWWTLSGEALPVEVRVVCHAPKDIYIGRRDSCVAPTCATGAQACRPFGWRAKVSSSQRSFRLSCGRLSHATQLVHRFRRSAPKANLLNLYGSTEVAADCTWVQLTGGGSGLGSEDIGATMEAVPIPIASIGCEIPGCRIELLDPETLVRMPDGEVGEICVSGTFLAEGYQNMPEATATNFPWLSIPTGDMNLGEAFRPSSPGADGSVRHFRTGDFAHRLHGKRTGHLYFVGRRDDQIKLRGMRVALLEVEAVMQAASRAAGALQLAVAFWCGSSESLVTFLSPESADARALLRQAAKMLPAHMVPPLAFCLSALPMLPNGKIDRQALRIEAADPRSCAYGQTPVFLATALNVSPEAAGGAPTPGCGDGGTMTALQPSASAASDGDRELTPTEIMLQRIWSELTGLSVRDVGLSDSLAQLGGTSLQLVSMVSQLRARGIQGLTVKRLASAPSLRATAELVDSASVGGSYATCGSQETLSGVDVDLATSGCSACDVEAARRRVDAYFGAASLAATEAGATRRGRLEDVWPLSCMQAGVLFHHVLDHGHDLARGSTYLEQFVFPIVGCHPLQADALRDAWQATLMRHPALRASFEWVGRAQHAQCIAMALDMPWTSSTYAWPDGLDNGVGDGAANTRIERQLHQLLEQFLAQDRRRGFDLSTPPLMRCHLAKIQARSYSQSNGVPPVQHALVLTIHHILFDGWSLNIILSDVANEYQQRCRLTTATPLMSKPGVAAASQRRAYLEFIEWERQQDLSAAHAYFAALLAGLTAPTPMFSSSRSTGYQAERHTIESTEPICDGSTTHQCTVDVTELHRMASSRGCSLASAVHTAWSVVASACSRSDDVLYATTVSGRSAPLHCAKDLVGLLLNTLPVRVDVSSPESKQCASASPDARENAFSFAMLLSRVNEQILSSLEYESCPLTGILQHCVPPCLTESSNNGEHPARRQQLLWAMLDFEPEQRPIALHTAEAAIGMDEIEDAGCSMLAPMVIDRIGFAFSLRVVHRQVRDESGAEQHLLRLTATSEDKRIGAHTLERLLAALTRCMEEAGSSRGEVSVMSLQKEADASFHVERPAIAAILPPLPSLPAGLLHEYAMSKALDEESRHHIAVVDAASDERLSYEKLEATSRRVAHAVLDLGVRPSADEWYCEAWGARPQSQRSIVVAVACERSRQQVVGVIGALRASCVYLPIDPLTPAQRALQLLTLSGTQAVLTSVATSRRCAWLASEHSNGNGHHIATPPVVLVDGMMGCSGAEDATDRVAGLAPIAQVQAASARLSERAMTMAGRPTEGRDLAYIIYTSGSTGVPKGVGCHHEGAVNTIDDVNRRHDVCASDACLALSSLSFDLSVYDIFGLLSCGGCVVIPDARHVSPPAPAEWCSLVSAEGVSVWNSVPAFAELLVGDAEVSGARLPASLRLLLLSGDWVPVSLPSRLLGMGRHGLRVVSMGGATEAAIWSVTHELVDGAVPAGWSSVPYGVPMRHQTMEVLDSEMRRCEAWSVGMIHIGGAGVALGYVGDSALSARSFVCHPRSGAYLFRTGDLGRVRPGAQEAGLLIEILGREDAQVKLNGYRVELGEIETALEAHPQVMRACALATDKRQLIAFILPPVHSSKDISFDSSPAPDAPAQSHSTTRVEYWRELYNFVYGSADDAPVASEFAGWESSYDGKPIPEPQMLEWLGHTVERIGSFCGRSVLEIGAGSGMLLARIARHCDRYWATDVSEEAIASLERRLQGHLHGALAIKAGLCDVRLFAQPAHHSLQEHCSPSPTFDTVLVNSVAQYFPSAEYLLEFVKQIGVALGDAPSSSLVSRGCIFLGDLRSFRHLRHFHSSVQTYRLLYGGEREPSQIDGAPDTTLSALRGALDAALMYETELCVDPELFLHADRSIAVDYCRVLLKRGAAHNEMNAFRYDLLLFTVDRSTLPRTAPLDAVDEMNWRHLDGGVDGITGLKLSLAATLHGGCKFVIVRDVPNLLLASAHAMLEQTRTAPDTALLADSAKAAAKAAAESVHAMVGEQERDGLPSTVAILYELGAAVGCVVEVTWGSEDHLLDAAFALHSECDCPEGGWARTKGTAAPVDGRLAMMPHLPSFHGLRRRAFSSTAGPDCDFTHRPLVHGANDPLLAETARNLIASLRELCETRLLPHLRPSAYVVTQDIPLTNNGKVDRAALSRRARGAVAAATASDRDLHHSSQVHITDADGRLTPVQSRLRAAWARVLGHAESTISLDDNFFQLGGDSLASLRVVSAISTYGFRVSVRDLFTSPSIRLLSSLPCMKLDAIPLDAPIRSAWFQIDADIVDSDAPFPLLGMQRAYWIGQQVGDPSTTMGSLNPHIYTEYEIPAECSSRLLGCAIDALVLRHPMLRAVVTPDGMLRTLPPASVPAYSVQTIAAGAVDSARTSMLAHGPRTDDFPLFDVRISRCSRGVTRIHSSISLFLMDGFTELILRHELAAIYLCIASLRAVPSVLTPTAILAASELPIIDVSFHSYTHSMLVQLPQAPVYSAAREYWSRRTSRLPPAPDIPRLCGERQWPTSATLDEEPAYLDARFIHHGSQTTPAAWAAIQAQCAQRNVSVTSLLLTLYGLALARYATSNHFVLNVLYTMRHPVHAHVRRVVGNFSSSILFEFDARGGEGLPRHAGEHAETETRTLADIVVQTLDQLWSDLEHCCADGISVMQELNQQNGQPFQAVAPFAFVSTIGLSLSEGDDETADTGAAFRACRAAQVFSCVQTPQTLIDHQVEEEQGCLRFSFDIVRDQFPRAVSDGIMRSYETMLNALARSAEVWTQPWSNMFVERPAIAAILPPLPSLPAGLLHEYAMSKALDEESRHHIAVVDAASDERLSYEKLEATSRRVAHAVLDLGVRPSADEWYCEAWGARPQSQRSIVVAVACERSRQQVVGVIGALRASCVYLPIDPLTPAQRALQLLTLSGTQAVLTSVATSRRCAWLASEHSNGNGHHIATPPVVLVDGMMGCSGAEDATDRVAGLAPIAQVQAASARLSERAMTMAGRPTEGRDLAYIIYTSGSTGVPKGVGCHHEGAVNTIDDVNRRHDVCASDACLALSSLSFDLSVYDIFGLLSCGGCVVIPDARHVSPPAPAEWCSLVSAEGVSVWNSVPAFAELLVGDAEVSGARLPASLRLLLLSGDWVPVSLPSRLLGMGRHGLRVVSMGGATEAAIWSVTHELVDGAVPAGWSSVPYGVPMRHQTMEVLDSEMRRCEAWSVGMIHIGGAGVALGYVGDSALSARSFVCHPRSGAYLFRTGDLGRVRPGAQEAGLLIEILGREDAQVKLNGYRVELGEIDHILQRSSRVATAATIARDRTALMSYIVPATQALEGVDFDPSELAVELLADCKQALPPYLVPRTISVLRELPLGPNGKLDRPRLATTFVLGTSTLNLATGAGRADHSTPIDHMETSVQQAFAQVLKYDDTTQVSTERSFFSMGGDSLSALRLILSLRKTHGYAPSVQQLFHHPSVAETAEWLRLQVGTVPREQTDGGGAPLSSRQLELVSLRVGKDMESRADELPVLILVHAAGVTALSYLPVLDGIDHCYSVYAIDDRSLRVECKEPLATIEAVADAASDLVLSELQRGRTPQQSSLACVVGGWSYGGTVAACLAARLERVGATVGTVVLLDAPFQMSADSCSLQQGFSIPPLAESDAALTQGLHSIAASEIEDAAPLAAFGEVQVRAQAHFRRCSQMLERHIWSDTISCDVVDVRPQGSELPSCNQLSSGSYRRVEIGNGATHWTLLQDGAVHIISALLQQALDAAVP